MLNKEKRKFLKRIRKLKKQIKRKTKLAKLLDCTCGDDTCLLCAAQNKMGMEIHILDMELFFLESQKDARIATDSWD